VIDHVTIRVPELEAGRRFYDRVFRLLELQDAPYDGGDFAEWEDFSIAQATAERPPTRRLHVGVCARSRDQVDEWWRRLTDAGHTSDGEPGPRPEYGPGYYGAFVLDPGGNSVEAVIHDETASFQGVIDHLWLRVTDLERATRFYETLAPIVGHTVDRLPGRTRIGGDGPTVSLLVGPPTEELHLAFAAPDRTTVDTFHAAGIGAG
jgi:catechol 2,3-dioxygenase-like lactoylglutathione lyase family enzyme